MSRSGICDATRQALTGGTSSGGKYLTGKSIGAVEKCGPGVYFILPRLIQLTTMNCALITNTFLLFISFVLIEGTTVCDEFNLSQGYENPLDDSSIYDMSPEVNFYNHRC